MFTPCEGGREGHRHQCGRASPSGTCPEVRPPESGGRCLVQPCTQGLALSGLACTASGTASSSQNCVGKEGEPGPSAWVQLLHLRVTHTFSHSGPAQGGHAQTQVWARPGSRCENVRAWAAAGHRSGPRHASHPTTPARCPRSTHLASPRGWPRTLTQSSHSQENGHLKQKLSFNKRGDQEPTKHEQIVVTLQAGEHRSQSHRGSRSLMAQECQGCPGFSSSFFAGSTVSLS